MTEEDKNDRLSPRYIGPEKLLSLFSENDWSQFCLAYLLTDRDFSGVLGLAWEGKAGESHHNALPEAKQRQECFLLSARLQRQINVSRSSVDNKCILKKGLRV